MSRSLIYINFMIPSSKLIITDASCDRVFLTYVTRCYISLADSGGNLLAWLRILPETIQQDILCAEVSIILILVSFSFYFYVTQSNDRATDAALADGNFVINRRKDL